MKCPNCQSEDSKVLDSRQKKDRRYRKRCCNQCGHRYPTTELIGTVSGNLPLLAPSVQKKSGKVAPFDRNKLMQSISVAVRKSRRDQVPINDIVSAIEQEVNSSLGDAVNTVDIGEQVLKALREHDRLAYVRYLSVHQQMETSDEIKSLIGELENLLASDSYGK